MTDEQLLGDTITRILPTGRWLLAFQNEQGELCFMAEPSSMTKQEICTLLRRLARHLERSGTIAREVVVQHRNS